MPTLRSFQTALVRSLFVVGLVASPQVEAFAVISPRYSGSPVAQVFTDRDIPGSPQARSVFAHPSGLIYVANADGLAEYDGASWKIVPGTRGLIVHNVAGDAKGRIWYSATDEFGVLVSDENGVLRSQALQHRLPREDRAVGHVLRMVTHGEEAYFVTQGARSFIARVSDGGNVHSLFPPADERCLNVFTMDGAVHVVTTEHVYRLQGETWMRLDAADALATPDIHSVWPRRDGGAWVVSAAGLRLWQHDSAPLVSNEVSSLLVDDRVSCGCPLGDGTFALGTEKHGVLIVEAATGQILARYDDDGGLGAASGTVVAVTLDEEGGLWLSRFGGATRIQIISPSALHDRPGSGVRGRVQAFAFHRERLHVATTQGVFSRDPVTGRFEPVPQAAGDTWVLLPTEDGLIVGGPDLRLLRPDGTIDIIERERLLFRSAVRLRRDPDRLVACTGPGLVRIYLRAEGVWRFETGLPNVRASLYPIFEDDAGWLWATRNRIEVVRLDWRKGLRTDASLESVGPAHGLPLFAASRQRMRIFLIDGAVEVTSIGGVWRHDATLDRFSPEDRIENLDPARWSHAYPLTDGSLWFAGNGEHELDAIARPMRPGAWRLEPIPYTGLEAIQPLEVCDDPAANTIWLGHLGLASFDRGWRGHRAPPPRVRLRSMVASGERIIWGGHGAPPGAPFPPDRNSLRFNFAALSLQPDAFGSVATEYRTQLVGFDDTWSAWTDATQREYSNLPPGNFSLRLQARDRAGREGPPAGFAFVLLPPWWRTWWAWYAYAVVAAGFVTGLVRLRTRVLYARNERLRRIVRERTQELSRQNEELARLHKLELDEKTTARLAAEKSRLETLRYQLNPHFLFNSLTLIRSQIPPGLLRARDAIDRLADFCRTTLHDRHADERVPLGEEMAMLRSYLEIERSRLGELLIVDFAVDPAATPDLVPRLLLLPLVENALKYGAATSSERLELRISARRENEAALLIEIANTGSWVDPTAARNRPSLGIGHENLRERLKRHYPDDHTFSHASAGGWVRVTLRLGQSRPSGRPALP